ncbi:MoaD/ThiS family protein [Nonomuraea endophytica]|uniref:MoaD/ThiS family protein n=1 Tax=Nonomuraea endophytica TaxID=714136 RepID=UPI0037C84DFD
MLLRSADNQRTVPIVAGTLNDALTELTARFPDTKRLLLDNAGRLRQAHRVMLNGELLLRPHSALPLAEDDRVEFFTAIAGG